MYVNRIDDPRGPLQLASRYELYQCARANGITEIDEAMYMGPYAAEKMKKILTAKGITNIKTVLQPFGSPPGTERPSGKTYTLDQLIAEETAVRSHPSPTIDHHVMTRAELAKEAKRRGIKMARTDTKEQLRERLSESHAS